MYSKTKRFVTSSVLVLTISSPLLSGLPQLGAVHADTKSDTLVKTNVVVDKLSDAIKERDLAHKEFVDASVEYGLNETKFNDIKSTVDSKAKDVPNGVYDKVKSSYDKSKLRLDKAEKAFKIAQAKVDALKVDSVNDKSVASALSGALDLNFNTDVKKVKSAKIKYVDDSGNVVDTMMFDLPKLEKIVEDSKALNLTSKFSVKSLLDNEKSKLEALVNSKQSLILKSGRYSVSKADSTFEGGEYVVNVLIKQIDGLKVSDDTKIGDKQSTTTTVEPSTTEEPKSTTTTTTTEPVTTEVLTTEASTTTTTTTEAVVEQKGQTSADGVLTDILFAKSNDKASIKGMIEKSKLPDGQKLEGDYANVVVTKADGTELATIKVGDDYKFNGELNSEPKEFEKLIIKYGGKVYEIDYTLDTNKKQTQSAQTSDEVRSYTDKNDKTKRNAKVGILPSTGQQNVVSWTIFGLVSIVIGSLATYFGLKNKKQE